LNSRGQKIGDKGACAIAACSQHLPILSFLFLSSNSIGEVGIVAIVKTLMSCPNLTVLDLQKNNQISDYAATQLETALKSNFSLTN